MKLIACRTLLKRNIKGVAKTWLIMKMTTILILAFCLNAHAKGYAQKLSFSKKDVPLEKIFKEITKQTGYTFVYTESLLKKAKQVTINTTNATLEQVLQECFKNQSLTFSILNKLIILKEKDKEEETKKEHIFYSPPPAPPINISGKVSNDLGQPLAGASIKIKGSTMGTVTDADGKFTLQVPDNSAVIIISYVGFEDAEVPVTKSSTINLSLKPKDLQTEEVVVVGYGIAKRKDLTGAIAQISAKEINAFPSTNIMQALQGRASGVQVLQNSGSPGGNVSVRIRGTNSILGGNEPLYVIDGFPFSGNPTFLQNADIQSIEVLKDASSIAIYGSRGANGVVIITTKNGSKSGRTFVDFESAYSSQSPAKTLKLMNASQYAELYNEQAKNDNLSPYFTQDQIDKFKASPGTDWQDVVMHNAPLSTTNLTVSGGNEKTQFSVSTGVLKQQGIIRNSDYNRYSVRANINHDISKVFSFSYNATLSRIDSRRQNSGRSGRGGDLISAMIGAPATLSPYKADGSYTRLNTAYPFISNVLVNPLTTLNFGDDRVKADRLFTNAAFTIKPFAGLSVRISGGVENANDRTDFYGRIDTTNNGTGYASVGTTQLTSLLNENVVTYSKRISRHNISATTGFTYQNFISTGLSAAGSGFLTDVTRTANLQSASSVGIPNTGYTRWDLLSFIGRLNYSFTDKYLLTFSFRRDGSSRYSADNKWSNFPSAAIAWRVSDENFFKGIHFISDLKLRASYGSTGSTAISPYQTLNQLTASKTIFGDALYNALAPSFALPGNLKWETTYQFDAGMDAGIFDSRIKITIDYYQKKTKNLLNTVQLPSSTGYAFTVKNVGEIENKGLEIGANAAILKGTINWNASANISFNRNKVVKLYGGQDIFGSTFYTGPINDYINLLREGQPLGVFYGYKEKGYTSTGNLAYEDFNNDNKITPLDKIYIGNPNPDFVYGFNSNVSYKNVELSLFLQGSQGNDIYNLNASQVFDLGFGLNMPEDLYYNHWTSAKIDTKYPKISRTLSSNISNRFVEDGSYLRVKNIQLAYNLISEKLKAGWMKNIQFYLSGQNLITFTKYSWYDPEINSFGGSNSINQGIDYYSYPTAKSVTFGVKCSF